MKIYRIRNNETEEYLSAIHIDTFNVRPPLYWSKLKEYGMTYKNEEIATAVIKFIGEVIDWELKEQLEPVSFTFE